MYRQLLSIVLFALLFASCSDNLTDSDTSYSESNKITFDFSVNKVFEQETRSGETPPFDEKIDHIYLLFYSKDSNGNAEGKPVAVTKGNVQDSKLTFSLPSELHPGARYKLVAIANADYYKAEGTSDSEAYLKNTSYSDLNLYNSGCITRFTVQGLPMQATDDFSFTKNGSGYDITKSDSLLFYRLAARLDIFNGADDFVIESIALCNWRDAVYLNEASTLQGEIQGKISSEDTGLAGRFNEVDPDGQRLDGVLYCFPSVVENSSQGDEITTALIIKAKRGDDTSSSYYRVNLGCNGSRSVIKPNTKYVLNISKVNGTGFSTAYKAYSSFAESQIVTAVVEDWNIDGGKYVTDSEGHILGVSDDSLEFDCDNTESQVIKVLCSTDLTLSATFIPDDGTPANAFSISHTPAAGSPISTLTITPSGMNDEETSLTGICRISASKAGKEYLQFDISLKQISPNDKPYVPEIPDNLKYGLIPLVGPDRVTVDHVNNTIEVNGFDPNSFNSFIDIPFKLYVKKDSGYGINTVSTDLKWPLEGGITKESLKKYYYCANSFLISGAKVYSETDGEVVGITSTDIMINSGDSIMHLLIGAMAPDDPAIINKRILLTLKNSKNSTEYCTYTLSFKPCDVIMDDVILTDTKNQSWLIFDRNVQDANNTNVGRKSDGTKRQAYNFTKHTGFPFTIPNKYKALNTPFSEDLHALYKGLEIDYDEVGAFKTTIKNYKYKWLNKYVYSSESLLVRYSPFYEAKDTVKWEILNKDVLELCKSKMKVSKMRMFLVSDVPAKKENKNVPICCYWPFRGNLGQPIDNLWFGYYSSNPTNPLVMIYCDKTHVELSNIDLNEGYKGLTRLVRQLSNEDITNYKTNYLGYGGTCRLQYCHPDTYNATNGWLPN